MGGDAEVSPRLPLYLYRLLLLFASISLILSFIGWIVSQSIWGPGIFWSSWMTFSCLYLATSLLVHRKGGSGVDSIVVAVTTVSSMALIYEVAYHYGFWVSWNYWAFNPFSGNWPLFGLFILGSLGVVANRRYFTLNKFFIGSIISFSLLFVLWVVIGYPQVANPGEIFPFAHVLLSVPGSDSWAYPLNALWSNDTSSYSKTAAIKPCAFRGSSSSLARMRLSARKASG